MRVADETTSRKRPRARGRTRCEARICAGDVSRRNDLWRLIQGSHRRKPGDIAVSICGFPNVERLSRKEIGTARTGVRNLAAMAECRSKGQATAPIGSIGNLPTTNHEVGDPADVTHIFLASTHRQLVNGAEHEYVVAAEIIRTVGEARIDRIV